MANISIVGIKGVGKTVFLTVLAKRFGKSLPGRPHMAGKGRTQRYVGEKWKKLHHEQTWPGSTSLVEGVELIWELRTGKEADRDVHHISVCDGSGQDFKIIYDPKPGDKLTEAQKEHRNSIENSDIVVFLINPSEAINATQTGSVHDIEISVVEAVRSLLNKVITQRNVKICILLSMYDQVSSFLDISKCADPLEALEKCGLHQIRAIALSESERIHVAYVASVADTEANPDFDPTTKDGKFLNPRRPKKFFSSTGIEEFMKWLIGELDGGVKAQEGIRKKAKRQAEAKWIGQALIFFGISYAVLYLLLIISTWFIYRPGITENKYQSYEDYLTALEKEVDFNYEIIEGKYFKVKIDKSFIGNDGVILKSSYPGDLHRVSITLNDFTLEVNKLKQGEIKNYEYVHNFRGEDLTYETMRALTQASVAKAKNTYIETIGDRKKQLRSIINVILFLFVIFLSPFSHKIKKSIFEN